MKLFEKMEKTEVVGKPIAGSVTVKEVKKRRRSVEKGTIGESATGTGSADHSQVAGDEPPLSPVADVKLSEISTVEAVKVKHDGMESSTEDVVATEAVAGSSAVDSTAEDNSQSCVVDNMTANDIPAAELTADTEVQSPCDISESRLTPYESPTKPIMQTSMADSEVSVEMPCMKVAVVPLEVPCVKVDANDTSAAAVTDKPATTMVKSVEDIVELTEKMPSTELTKIESDASCVDETIITMRGEPIPTTVAIMQTDVIKSETADETKKADVTLETKLRAAKGSPNERSTAKLKFGMYARRPLASRTFVTATEHEKQNSSNDSSDNEEDLVSKSTSESETATTPNRRRPVKFVRYFHLFATFCCLLDVGTTTVTSQESSPL